MVGQVAADKWLSCCEDVAGCRGMSRDVAKMSRKCRGDVAGCRGDVAGCRGDVAEMSRGVASVSPSVTEMSTHVTLRSTRRHVDTRPLRWGVSTMHQALGDGVPLPALEPSPFLFPHTDTAVSTIKCTKRKSAF